MKNLFRTGLEVLLDENLSLLKGKRVGMVVHPASLTTDGTWSPELIHQHPDIELTCLLGPEHGAFGHAGAGEPVASATHPAWNIPVHSLYGDQRKPTPEMLDALDVIIVDLQDLGVRCYTFISTLDLLLEAAAEQDKTIIVTDRPIPFPSVFDGPLLDPAFRSFVAQVPVPLVYGMTQGEAAMFIAGRSHPDLDLHVIEMDHYASTPRRDPAWPPWVPPSTGIRSWETAWCYPATVFCEALPALECGRGGPIPFQTLTAPWMNGRDVAAHFEAHPLAGARILPHTHYRDRELVEGIRIVVTDPAEYRPVTLGLTLIEHLQFTYGTERIWSAEGTRQDFFDQLCGTDQVRRTLLDGNPVSDLATHWQSRYADFLEQRSAHLLYA